MAILWCGGEDIDCQLLTGSINTSTSVYRTAYARCAIATGSGQLFRGNTFPGGAQTSAWATCRLTANGSVSNSCMFGFTQASSGRGLFVGTNNISQVILQKYNGTTATTLATEGGTSFSASTIFKVDMQVINYGVTATVNVYLNGSLLITFTGDVTVSGMTNFDSVGNNFTTGFGTLNVSEMIVASEDTRGFPGLMTMALTGAGTTDQWSGVFSTINQVSFSDTSPNFTNTVAQDQQFNITDLVAGVFTIKAVKISARSAVSSPTPTATKIAFGYNSGGTVAVGAAQSPSTGYATLEELDNTNPVTGLPWVQSDMNALQLDMRSS